MKEYIKNLGKVVMTPKGAWSIKKEYEILDIVHDSVTDHAYISKQEVPSGVDLSDSRYWMPLNVSGYSDSNVITLNSFNEDGEIQSYTLEKAIKTIKGIGRKSGAILIFYNNNVNRLDITTGCWEIWQFNSINVYDWENLNSWVNIYYNYNKFVGWYAADNILNKEIPNPDVGCYAFVGNIYNEAFVYRCDIKNQWTKTNQKAQHYIKVVFGDNIVIGDNGHWWQDGVDTNIPVSVKGDNGLTPYFRWSKNNQIEYSYDNVHWYILSGKFNTKIKIKDYVNTVDDLPNNTELGTIYGVGPIYSEEDVNHINPIYMIHVYTSNGWINNGGFNSISAGIVQELGHSETEIISQKAITEEFSKTETKVGIITSYELEIGAYYPDDNTYNDNVRTRLRFKRDTSVFLHKNSIIKLKDYTNATLRVAWSIDNINWELYKFSAWLKEDYICTEDAYYRIAIEAVPETEQDDVNVLGKLLEIKDSNSNDAINNYMHKINNECAIIPPYRLEIGTYYPDTNRYENSINTRVRLHTGSSIHLEKGSIIKLKNYTDAELRVTYLINGVWSENYSEWIREDYVCPETADYKLCICSIPEVEQTNVNTLGDLLEIIPYKSNEYFLYKLFQNINYPVLYKNVSCCDNKSWKEYPIFKAVIDCKIEITFKNTLDTYIRDEYANWASQYTTFGLTHVKNNGERIVIAEKVAQSGLSPHTKTYQIEMNQGDSLLYGDRLVGSYEYISVKYIDATGVNFAIDIINKTLSDSYITSDVHSDATLTDATNFLNKRVTFAHFSDIHNDSVALNNVLSICNNYKKYISDILYTGDYSNYFELDFDWWVQNNTSNILGVIGNHEIQSLYTVGSQYAKTENIGKPSYDKFIKPFISNWGILGTISIVDNSIVYSENNPSEANIFLLDNASMEGYSFYYKDYKNLRLIVLDWTNFNTPQKLWLEAVLNDALVKKLAVVVSAHYPSARIIKSGNKFDSITNSHIESDNDWFNVFTEYDAHIYIQNFINNGGEFVCWLCGHTHKDNFGYIEGYTDQTVITVDSAQIDPLETDIMHAGDTSFNLISIDVESGYFYLLRLGANKDMHGRVRDTLTYDYRRKRTINR